MRRTLVALVCALVGVSLLAPAATAASVRPSQGVNWGQRDTAVYVVSTLNLLRTKRGDPLVNVMKRRLGVDHYNVYADTATPDLYFIDLARIDDSVAGTFAYKMGWLKPQIVSTSLRRFRVRQAPQGVLASYRTDRKALIGTFTSTLPS